VNKPAKNWLEWGVFAVSLVLVLGTLGFLVRDSLAGTGGPPEVVARLGAPTSTAGGYQVPVQVVNRGQGTAEDVTVTVVLESAGGEREEAQLAIAFLPRGSLRNGFVTFRSDPSQGDLRLGAVAFEVP
jgi:uncharacterized protein (TIGR02588 family)